VEHLSEIGGVEVGHDRGFEQKWWTFMQSVWTGMALLVIVGLTGALGRGPLNNVSARSGSLSARYERLMRFKTPSEIRLEVASPPSGQFSVEIRGSCFQKSGVRSLTPEPIAAQPLTQGAVYTFPGPAKPTPATIAVAFEPGSVGPVDCHISAGTDALSIRQFILP
jgi:hypothetical protein